MDAGALSVFWSDPLLARRRHRTVSTEVLPRVCRGAPLGKRLSGHSRWAGPCWWRRSRTPRSVSVSSSTCASTNRDGLWWRLATSLPSPMRSGARVELRWRASCARMTSFGPRSILTCASPVPARSSHLDSKAMWSSVTFDSPVRASWARSDSTRTPAFFVEPTRCGSRYRLA